MTIAERRLKDLEEDAKRLDGLDTNKELAHTLFRRRLTQADSRTLREAIDAALSSHHPTAPVPDEGEKKPHEKWCALTLGEPHVTCSCRSKR
jgi:hypothetical protein